MTIRVQVPGWALYAGMPEPEEDESFDSYWRRVGVDEDTLTTAHEGLTERTEEVANARMGSYLLRKMPEAFDRYVERKRKCG